jgi:hypothetical protein
MGVRDAHPEIAHTLCIKGFLSLVTRVRQSPTEAVFKVLRLHHGFGEGTQANLRQTGTAGLT